MDQSGSRAAPRRRSRSPLDLRRHARGQPRRSRAIRPKVLGTALASGGDRPALSPTGTRVAVEISARRSRTVKRWSASSGCPRNTPTTASLPQLLRIHAPASRGASSPGAGPLDSRSPPARPRHRDRPEPRRRLFKALDVNSRLEASPPPGPHHRLIEASGLCGVHVCAACAPTRRRPTAARPRPCGRPLRACGRRSQRFGRGRSSPQL